MINLLCNVLLYGIFFKKFSITTLSKLKSPSLRASPLGGDTHSAWSMRVTTTCYTSPQNYPPQGGSTCNRLGMVLLPLGGNSHLSPSNWILCCDVACNTNTNLKSIFGLKHWFQRKCINKRISAKTFNSSYILAHFIYTWVFGWQRVDNTTKLSPTVYSLIFIPPWILLICCIPALAWRFLLTISCISSIFFLLHRVLGVTN